MAEQGKTHPPSSEGLSVVWCGADDRAVLTEDWALNLSANLSPLTSILLLDSHANHLSFQSISHV